MRNELANALNILNRDPQVKVMLIMSKNDKAFCAGADITGFVKESHEK
jgi:enoyl-CoA hydratase/carnithine racemase